MNIVVGWRKGGIGKTTLAAHIAGGLAIKGYNVALVDTDSQGHAAIILGMPKENGLYNLLVNGEKITDVVRPVPLESYSTPDQPPAGSLWLLPGDTDTFIIPLKVQSALSLRSALRRMKELLNLDIVILDTAPTASMFDGAVYFAADGLLFLTECETLSLDGLNEGLRQLDLHQAERQEMNMPPLPVIGVQPNKMRPSTKSHKAWIADLGTRFPGLVWPPIPQKTLWTQATEYGQLLYSYAPSSGEASSAWEVVNRVEEAYKQWQAIPAK